MFDVRFPRLGLLVVLALGVPAQSAEPSPARSNPPNNREGDAQVGPVQSARGLLGLTVKSGQGEVFGKIQDVGLDIGTGTVATIFVKPAGTKDGTDEYVTIPIRALTWSPKSQDVVLEGSISAEPKEPADPDAKSQVILLSSASKIAVHNAQGEKLGQVVDFALARQKGLIAFAVFVREGEKSTDTRYPIPLSAFVVPDSAKHWILDLPDDVLTSTPTFKQDAWPTTISGAWTEYVHVRYGRSPFGGVQRKLRDKTTENR
jgi:sporulation protein YlmC with PRC-barrel domain